MPQRGKEGKFLSRALQSPNSRYENTLAMFALAAEDEVVCCVNGSFRGTLVLTSPRAMS